MRAVRVAVVLAGLLMTIDMAHTGVRAAGRVSRGKHRRGIQSVVRQMVPPSASTPFCGQQEDGITTPGQLLGTYLDLSCSLPGATLSIDFASYGTLPAGTCGHWTTPSCTAMNTSAVVTQLCQGQGTCRIWPNTTTFGDPCFGVKKYLEVQAHCSSGAGGATPGCAEGDCPHPAPPPPPPPAPTQAVVSVDWGQTGGTIETTPTLQVVAHSLLMRDSPIHDKLFTRLSELNASYVRYVPWLPTPRLGVAELEPPSGTALCVGESVGEGGVGVLDCGATGGVLEAIEFASFGAHTGTCGKYAPASGHTDASRTTIEALCLGRQGCTIPASRTALGLSSLRAQHDNPVTIPTLVVQARCSERSKQHTYWNFTLLDHQMLDYWAAVGGQSRPQIPNFSTPPTWLYDATSWGYNTECTAANGCLYGGYEKGTAPASAHGGLPALGDYYGRLLAWYTRGGFTDEYGTQVDSGHTLNITLWEIYNEVDYEHGHTPQSYVQEFDAIVAGIRTHADPNHTIAFVGMSLPNIDSTATVVEWATYFLNGSNHASGARDALQYIGYHAYPTNDVGPIATADDMTKFFEYVDEFVDVKIPAVQAVVAALSPATKTLLDECGTMGPLLGGLTDPAYWVASGGYWAYMWARVAVSPHGPSIPAVGQSQFMDSPGREPGVTMMNWETGEGTAKYWVTKMVIDSVSMGDVWHPTNSSAPSVFAMGYTHGSTRHVLLVNKQNANTTVEIAGATSAVVVDGATNEQPPRLESLAGTIVLAPFATAIVTIVGPRTVIQGVTR